MSSVLLAMVVKVGVLMAIGTAETSSVIDYERLGKRIEQECVHHCPLQNRTDLDRYDYACDFDCNIDQCSKGCALWKMALSTSCQQACNGTSDRLSNRELHCVIGCNDAIGKYLNQIRVLLGTPPAPALLDNSLNSTQLKLEWRFPEATRARLSCHVQWRYEEIVSSWQYCRNATWNSDTSHFSVLGLQPYTKYRFRIALNLGHGHGDPIYSEQSVVISTLAYGPPVSPPTNVRVAPVDAHSVNVSWEPGLFPHGPLLSYVLHITDLNSSAPAEVKDVPATSFSYIIRNLPAGRTHKVSLQARNSYGNSPPSIVQVSTPRELQVSVNQQPILILGTKYGIYELQSLFGDSLHLFHSNDTTIEGMGIHIGKQLLFASDARGSVWRIPIEQETKNRSKILLSEQLDFYPLDVSVDWLNEQLYILGEVKPRRNPSVYLIQRCNLDGSGLTVALAGLTRRPIAFEIDPCNGYLFWVIRDPIVGGLYRLDISDISNGIKRDAKKEKILNGTDLGAFIVDYMHHKLFVSNQNANTMLALSMDGKDVEDIRKNVVNPKLHNVLSLGTVNQKFYWTDGYTVYNEEYHEGRKQYFHNKISHLGKSQYKKILINLNSSQPWPLPFNPPSNLQVVFGRRMGKASWLPPHLLGIQGRGSWQNWEYELSIVNMKTNDLTTYKTNGSTFVIRNLTEDTEYTIKVLAYSKSGKSPWSGEFRGSTLQNARNPIIIWSGTEGLYKSDHTVENVVNLIHKTRLRNVGFTRMTSYRDQIFMVSNSSHVYSYNLTSHKRDQLPNLDSVGAIAVDWLGKRLYWSNLKQQLIVRSHLNGTQQEPLPILTLAKEIRIDSVKGYLYWSREYDVECAHLNGDDKMSYEKLEAFTGKQVTALTLDFDNHHLYWIVRNSDGSHLFRAMMAGYGHGGPPQKSQAALIKNLGMQETFSCFSHRFLWLQDDKNAVISDLQGKNMAVINNKSIWGLNFLYVIDDHFDSAEGNIPNSDTVNIMPEAVRADSVRAVGSSDSFNITWDKVENVNYGTVFYEVQSDGLTANGTTVTTTENTIRYSKKVPPFSPLTVAIRAFTYWATAPQTRLVVISPQSSPSAPVNLRIFVAQEEDLSYSITFRWDPPLLPNGVVRGYNVQCGILESDNETTALCEDVKTQANETEYFIQNVNATDLLFFQVQAFTDIGTGTMTAQLFVNVTEEKPPPILLLASRDSITLQDVDISRNYPLLNVISSPLHLAFLKRENKVFWINDLQELYVYHVPTANKTKIVDLRGKGKGLTLDWLERSVYYVEAINDTSGSVVYKINLNYWERNVVEATKVLESANDVVQIEVAPFARRLYWIERDADNVQAMSGSLDGAQVLRLLNATPIEPAFTIDHSSRPHRLVFVGANGSGVFSMALGDDSMATKSVASQSGVLLKIGADSGSIYWTDLDGFLHVFDQRTGNIQRSDHALSVSDFKVYGQYVQPYPPKECLQLRQDPHSPPTVLKKSHHSITLKMPPLLSNDNCSATSKPSAVYILKYEPVLGTAAAGSGSAKSVHFFNNESFRLDGLDSFTEYRLSVAVSNHFTRHERLVFGAEAVVRTLPGAPSKPRDIRASVLHPTMAQVSWRPPVKLNGEMVRYEVHWLTEGSVTGVRQKGEQSVVEKTDTTQSSNTTLTTLLQKLSPNETYTVWIRAYSQTNETSSDSDRVQITTYPEPAVFELVNKTSHELTITWEITSHIRKYVVEYALITSSNNWTEAASGANRDSVVRIVVEKLTPKTQYKFRLSLCYGHSQAWYVWPSDSRFTFETLGDKPGPPGIPGIQFFGSNTYKVVWEASQENGAPIELYRLECLALRYYRNERSADGNGSADSNRNPWYYTAPSIEEQHFDWEQVYNGTDNFWVINDLSDQYKYSFRVFALNSYGWSEPSNESTVFDISEAERLTQTSNLIYIATVFPILVIMLLCFVYVICSRRCSRQKKIDQVVTIRRGPDVELATLRELPRRGVHSTNILYVSATPTCDDVKMLPHISRDQITLVDFLGSGAFGEVYEGRAKGLVNEPQLETKVAVKTLKKGASEQEKTEFLQEAQLMSHFKHEHILRLLGVCLDNDPHYIIMELMEGGDLLSYLRNSRGGLNNTPSLRLIDLLKMCLDVAKGCRYLEEMHFVHRDLACRNCLVSSKESDGRIVKIGDFGLARDIYRNDYYRKEGEGLLPVRWMALEALLDGVFTCQSDVWAFGVLLWEIMTLGQQPYQARSNLEVLHYVKGGGRLGKPVDCPEDLYKLMLECWEFEADKRPTFKHCLQVLERAHRDYLRNPTTGAHSHHYISTVPDVADGVSNAAYFLDENENNSGTSWKESEEDPNREQTPFLPAAKEIPKYLELLYEEERENEGYEVPNAMVMDGEDTVEQQQEISN